MSVNISQDDLDLIKSYLLFPLSESVLLTDDQIKKLCIYPALQKFAEKFPIKTTDEFMISDYLTLPFPDDYTFGITDIRLVNRDMYGNSTSMMDIIRYNSIMGTNVSKIGTPQRNFNPNGLWQQTLNNRYLQKTLVNKMGIRYDVDYQNKKVEISSQLAGSLNVTWAKWSDDFETVPFQRKEDVRQLAGSYLLQHYANTLKLLPPEGSGVTLSIEGVETRAKEMREEILTKWAEVPTIVLLKI